jgi:hypothetical protein
MLSFVVTTDPPRFGCKGKGALASVCSTSNHHEVEFWALLHRTARSADPFNH